jgi:hypothetical protein
MLITRQNTETRKPVALGANGSGLAVPPVSVKWISVHQFSADGIIVAERVDKSTKTRHIPNGRPGCCNYDETGQRIIFLSRRTVNEVVGKSMSTYKGDFGSK